MSGSAEIDLSVLGEDAAPGVREAVGLEELRAELEATINYASPVTLHFGGADELHGYVVEIGSGVLVFERFDADEHERVIVPLNKILWVAVKRRA